MPQPERRTVQRGSGRSGRPRNPWRAYRTLIETTIAGGVFLAIVLGIEWTTVELARKTIHGDVKIVGYIFDAIQIGSAMAVLLLFLLHAVMMLKAYIEWERKERE